MTRSKNFGVSGFFGDAFTARARQSAVCGLSLFFITSAASLGATAPSTSTPAVKSQALLNNSGVKALNQRDFSGAANFFIQALEIDPAYSYARENLGICYNNLALKSSPQDAMGLFHKAMLLQPGNQTTQANLDSLIRSLGRDPSKFQDRVSLGEEALKTKDYVTAVGEFEAALAIKQDDKVKKQLAGIPRTHVLFKVASAAHSAVAAPSTPVAPSASAASTQSVDGDFGPYMADLQRQIKKHWFPPKGTESKRVMVTFKVFKDGALSNLVLSKSCGVPEADRAALTAVSTAAPFASLPTTRSSVDIQFTFDYNVTKGSGGGRFVPVTDKQNKSIASEKLASAKALRAENKIAGALSLLDAAATFDSDNLEIPALQSELLCELAKKETAADKYEQLVYDALNKNPSNAVAQKMLADLVEKQGMKPESAPDRVHLAHTWIDKRDYKKARIELEQALKLDRKNEEASKLLPEVLARESAGGLVQRWQTALDKRNSAENRAGLAYAFEVQGNMDLAKEEYQKALSLDPYCTIAKERLAAIENKPIQTSTPEPEVNKQGKEEIKAKVAELLSTAADYRKSGKPNEAISVYMQLVRLESSSGEAWMGLATTLQGKADYERAIKAYVRALSIDPTNVDAANRLAECQKALKTSPPATSAPATTAPATAAPATAAPATSAPATSAPATSAPATSAPATSAPATSAPATSAPATSAPADTAPAVPSK